MRCLSTQVTIDNYLPNCMNFEEEYFIKANIKLNKPNCRLCFEVLVSVLLNKPAIQKSIRIRLGPGCQHTRVSLCSPFPRRSCTGSFPVSLGTGSCWCPPTSFPPVRGSASREATQPAAPTQAVQTRSRAQAVVLLGLTLASSLRPQLTPETLGTTDLVF